MNTYILMNTSFNLEPLNVRMHSLNIQNQTKMRYIASETSYTSYSMLHFICIKVKNEVLFRILHMLLYD